MEVELHTCKGCKAAAMEMEMHCKRGSRHICVQRQFVGEHGEGVELVGLFS